MRTVRLSETMSLRFMRHGVVKLMRVGAARGQRRDVVWLTPREVHELTSALSRTPEQRMRDET